MSTQPDSTVFVSRSGGRRCYHASLDCDALQRSIPEHGDPKDYDPEYMPLGLRACKVCHGGENA